MEEQLINQGQGIYTIDTGFQRRGLVASHLIQQGEHYAFIDVGTSSCLRSIQESMRKLAIRPEQIKYIMVTHVHLDHAGAAGVLMQLCPQAQLVVHPRGARHMIDPTKLIAGAAAVYGDETLEKTIGEIRPVAAERIIEATDELILELHGRPLLFLDTPGHAKHHYCVYDEASNSFFTGDTFGLSYEALSVQGDRFIFPTTTPVQFEPDALHHSIERMLSYQPDRMFLTHFGGIGSVPEKADDLHRHIDAFVKLADENYVADQTECVTAITAALFDYLQEELTQAGFNMSKEQVHEVMGMDIKLNAQGLYCYVSYKNRKRS